MAGFNFEKHLEHQEQAVQSTVQVFQDVPMSHPEGLNNQCINPLFDRSTLHYGENIRTIQEDNDISRNVDRESNIIDIMMETGTGKTYTYTKTIFELNKLYGIFKFIIVVPTVSIKAGTIDFLKSDSSREHFKEQYGKILKLHIIEKKTNKKRSFMPPAVNSFVNAGSFEKNTIQVLIVNQGMINSPTMQETFDRSLLDTHTNPFTAISATRPFMIIDEPHKFAKDNKTWENLEKMTPQQILRYGATFPEKTIKQKNAFGKLEKIQVKDYHNLIYTLSAVDSFNRNLVKGVIGHITEFETGKNALVKFTNSDGKEAHFQLEENNTKKPVIVGKKESLEKIHPAMKDLYIVKLNKTMVELSNGLDLKKGDKINPYSYAEKLQETMIQKAIRHHFEQEKKYLTREVKIKPLTLFFIDNIDEYRNDDGYIKTTVEEYIRAEVEELLKSETNEFYRTYLEKTLADVSQTHAGYFSQDTTKNNTDEKIEKEVNEILHDKQSILNLDNPRRFIFSKWTLREGWDNPNIFQICKLRSSGSEISKLQEVGRGLRLPVNEYGNRVKDEQFYLNYFVDFTENDFVDKLVQEINQKSGAISREDDPEKLHQGMIKQITHKYNIKEDDLLQKLDDENVIKRNNDFTENGFEYIKSHFPGIFEGVNSNKIRKASKQKKKLQVRTEKYSQLKELWEKLNQKVVLEYKIEHENEFKDLFVEFLKKTDLAVEGTREKTAQIGFEDNQAVIKEETAMYGNKLTPIPTMTYKDFLRYLSSALYINLKTIHECFRDAHIDINSYLNQSTLRILKQEFDNYLMYQAISTFKIGYQNVNSAIHPTTLTETDGQVKDEVNASEVGILYSDEKVADTYLFDELFYDSELEKENITHNISEVIVFTKIPKNSIKIPIAGGKSYSPDFAYVLNYEDGDKKLYFIVETKNTDKDSLRNEERQKIKHAEKFFGENIKIEFRTQFSNNKIANLIQEVYQ